MIRFILLFVSIIIVTGCSYAAKTPVVKLQKIIPVGIDSTGVDCEVILLVNNQNSFDLKLLGYSYNLQIYSIPFSSGGNLQPIIFPAEKNTLIKIPARIQHIDLIELLKRQPDPDRIPYRINAALQIYSPLGELTIPVEHDGQITIPEKYRHANKLKQLKDIILQQRQSPFSLAL